MQSNTTVLSPKATEASSKSKHKTLVGATMAAALGLVLLWGVGFSHIDAFHNAAHDTRHSSAFPCH